MRKTHARLIPLARKLRREATPAEVKLWQDLREMKKQGYHFRRQAPIGNYIVDFVCHSAKVVIELDGEHHALEPQKSADVVRDSWLKTQGYDVIRFWNSNIYDNQDYLMDALVQRLNDHRLENGVTHDRP